MTKKIILPFLLICLGAVSLNLKAQVKTDSKNSDGKEIIIRKKGNSKDKVTIVIDGDNVTINGKPVDEYKSDDIDIIKGDDADAWVLTSPDVAIAGSPKMFNRDFMRGIKSNKAFLGVMTKETNEGAEITDVTDESPAQKAGLKEDDIITKVGDDKITGPDDLYKTIGKYKPDDEVKITYKRDGKENTASAKLSKNDEARVFSWNGDDGQNFSFNMPSLPNLDRIDGNNFAFSWDSKPRLGIGLQDTDDDSGVTVQYVEEESAAEKAGLKEDDVITTVNGTAIKSTEDLKKIVKDAKPGDSYSVTYKRNGETKTTTVRFPKELKTIDL